MSNTNLNQGPNPFKKRITSQIPVKMTSQVVCATFPGIKPKEGESGSDYFTRVTRIIENWMETCLSVESTVEVIDADTQP